MVIDIFVCCIVFITVAVAVNTFGPQRVVLLRNVSCNSSHTDLSQCVSPEEIYVVPNDTTSCGDTRAGVKCVECVTTAPNAVLTTRPATNGGSSSAVSGTVIGAVIGVLAAVIIVIVIVVIVVVVVVVTKRREKSKELLGQEKTGKNENAHLKKPVYLMLSIQYSLKLLSV